MITDETHTEILNAHSMGFKCIDDRVDAKVLYGKCKIEVPIKPYVLFLAEEVVTPFYVFQMFSIILWIFEEYYWYAVALFVMAAASIAHKLFDKRQNLVRIHNIDCFHEINSEQLVPGDII
jgi:cation-transporting ATPase 13A3/4/5